jgi:uncharacterized protein YjbI with pentapeptide repeats
MAHLRNANLRGANLRMAKGLDISRLCEAESLHKAELEQDLEKAVLNECPDLRIKLFYEKR